MKKSSALGPRPAGPPAARGAGVRERLLLELAGREELATTTRLAEVLELHPNTVRSQLAVLEEDGLAQREQVSTGQRGRPAHGYRITAAGTQGLPVDPVHTEYRALTAAFAGYLAQRSSEPGSEAREVGRSWGTALAGLPAGARPAGAGRGSSDGTDPDLPQGRMLALLDRIGFSPARDARGVALRTCPLLDLALEMPDVICQVHRGLVEGALAQYGADSAQVDLVPFAEPGACRLVLPDPGGMSRK